MVTIIEEGVPKTYRRVWDPETETWVYVPDEEVPLLNAEAPETGDRGVLPWGLLGMLPLFGLVGMFFQGQRKKKDCL